MTSSLKDIPPLLHDARLSDCRWDGHLKTLDLCFQCLRRNVDGTPIEDSTVDLKLGGVGRVVAHYSPASVTVRPSEFEPGSRTTLADLQEWTCGAVEAHLAINSPQAEFDAATACVREALVGDPEDRPADTPPRVHVTFETHNHGPQGTVMGLSIDCDSLEPFTNGVPLDIETWERQFEAWWTGWRGHWAAKGEEPGDHEPALEDTFIPAGQLDPPDRSYRPPAAVPFLVPTTTTPAGLLKPVEDYHTGFHERDWLEVAAANPHFDFTPEERATRLRGQFSAGTTGVGCTSGTSTGAGERGDLACVVVRGIVNTKGEDSPARNEETVSTFSLRRSHRGWVIATWSQGWPRFGSADKPTEPHSWREGWNLAD